MVFFIAVLKSPKNVKKKKDWAKRYAITKSSIYLNYRFETNPREKKNFSDFWIYAYPLQ